MSMIRAVAFLEGIGGMEMFVIGILALLMFGSKRLPELGRAAGRAIREFKRATSGVEENLREVMRETPSPTLRPPARPPRPRSTPASAAMAKPATPVGPTPETPAGKPEVRDQETGDKSQESEIKDQ
ncbi:MAG: Sec-independent protein translocase subunit TatA/TatB [Opitutaceae bacterium]